MTPLAQRLASRRIPHTDVGARGWAVSLAELRPGQRSMIVGFSDDVDASHSRRLHDLGFAVGEEVRVIHRAPARDPFVYRVCGTDVALRRSLAKGILVHPS